MVFSFFYCGSSEIFLREFIIEMLPELILKSLLEIVPEFLWAFLMRFLEYVVTNKVLTEVFPGVCFSEYFLFKPMVFLVEKKLGRNCWKTIPENN